MELNGSDPERIGRYRVLQRLGHGGMGVVYLAETPGHNRVAVKCVHPHLASDAEFRRRFAREVAATRVVAGLCTAHVVDADPDAAVPYLVTEFVDGPTLAARVETEGALPPAAVSVLAAGLAEGLAAIHGAGVTHRDLKPGNVILSPTGPKIVDFGIAAALGASSLTQSGSVVGTPAWLSPEHVTGGAIGPPADVFSWAGIVTYAATGTPPFGAVSPDVYVARLMHASPDLTGVPGAIRPLLERAFSRNPESRPSAQELLTGLSGQAAEISTLTRRLPSTEIATDVATPAEGRASIPNELPRRRLQVPWLVGAVVVAIAAGIVAAIAATHHHHPTPAASADKTRVANPPMVSTTEQPKAAAAAVRTLRAKSGYRAFADGATGLRVQVPGSLIRESAASTGTGSTFTTSDDRVIMTATAIPNAARHSARQRLHHLLAVERRRNADVTLSSDESSVAAISGYEDSGQTLFYERDVVTPTTIYALIWRFPTGRRGRYNSEITHTAQTFHPDPAPSTFGSSGSTCPHIAYGADGTAGPLFCADGSPNPPVLAYYRTIGLGVLRLGTNATPGRVFSTMCHDLATQSTYPIETDAYDLAAKINDWMFGIDPVQEMTSGACPR